MGSREKEKKHKKEKHKKGGKERKHKKEKRGRHERKRCRSGSRSSSSSGGGGSSGDERLDVNQRLAMGRAAARATREILAYKPELARELREVRVGPLSAGLGGPSWPAAVLPLPPLPPPPLLALLLLLLLLLPTTLNCRPPNPPPPASSWCASWTAVERSRWAASRTPSSSPACVPCLTT